MAVTVGGTSITFNDGTTQTTAASGPPTTWNTVGSVAAFLYTGTSIIFAGNTVSGSYLFYVSARGSSNIEITPFARTYGTNVLNPGRTTAVSFGSAPNNITFTPVGGTWRALGTVSQNYTDVCGNAIPASGLFVRTA